MRVLKLVSGDPATVMSAVIEENSSGDECSPAFNEASSPSPPPHPLAGPVELAVEAVAGSAAAQSGRLFLLFYAEADAEGGVASWDHRNVGVFRHGTAQTRVQSRLEQLGHAEAPSHVIEVAVPAGVRLHQSPHCHLQSGVPAMKSLSKIRIVVALYNIIGLELELERGATEPSAVCDKGLGEASGGDGASLHPALWASRANLLAGRPN